MTWSTPCVDCRYIRPKYRFQLHRYTIFWWYIVEISQYFNHRLYLFESSIVPIWVIIYYLVTMSSYLHIWFNFIVLIYIYWDVPPGYCGIPIFDSLDLVIWLLKINKLMTIFVGSLWDSFGPPIVYIHFYLYIEFWLSHRFHPYLWHIFTDRILNHIPY